VVGLSADPADVIALERSSGRRACVKYAVSVACDIAVSSRLAGDMLSRARPALQAFRRVIGCVSEDSIGKADSRG
jgi:hypothetical protein